MRTMRIIPYSPLACTVTSLSCQGHRNQVRNDCKTMNLHNLPKKPRGRRPKPAVGANAECRHHGHPGCQVMPPTGYRQVLSRRIVQ